ncbi:hypothetical protein BG262_03025 [Floricoccus penangensis]|uniref:DUF262 domain-containing protein n=1 Tax=Floricoccus penangensis TaxID=1859475 RepID=A0A9Q5JG53_9LACT|nr:hypothetical protein BG262_03025 [Floricoccus penangensis]
MALLEEELNICNISELFDMNLKIPEYQRPYTWSTESVSTMFSDIKNAFSKNIEEYRLGTIILHKVGEYYNIVDGQQRITTLSILLYYLNENNKLLDEEYSNLSVENINRNSSLLKKLVKEVNKSEFKNYLLGNCTLVKIVTDEQQEAFQFFDSQNTRGKALNPHDLLKSYHLREMNSDSEEKKINVISKWENIDQNKLDKLFRIFLFPITQWYKNKNGLNYSIKDISNFKGIKKNNNFNYSIYHKSSNLFIEQLNSTGINELFESEQINQFQLNQPIVAGDRFFKWTVHYLELLKKIEDRVKNNYSQEEIPTKNSGDRYVYQLFLSVLQFFADRFGIENMDINVMDFFYTWSYSIRLKMQAVYKETINKYAQGKHDRINKEIDMFNMINEMNCPRELTAIIFEEVTDISNKKYEEIFNKIKKINGW